MIFEILKSIFIGVFDDFESKGAFEFIIRHSPKRVILQRNENLNRMEYFPQWRFFWWHYDYKYVGYQTLSTISFEDKNEAIKHAENMGVHKNNDKADSLEVWKKDDK